MPIITGFILLIVLSMPGYAQERQPDKYFHLYLLIGQSNMAGRGKPDKESIRTNTRILMLDSLNNWITASDPVHFDKPGIAGVGPALSFADAMLGNDPEIRIGLIPCAHGGSPIKVWQPGATYFRFHPYDDAIVRAREAMKNGVLKGILWHQGESDNDSLKASRYMEQLKLLVQHLRTDLAMPELPFVAGEIGYFNKFDHINKVLRQIPQQVTHAAIVTAEGLAHKGDQLHFDTPSARVLGERYASAMKKLQPAGKP